MNIRNEKLMERYASHPMKAEIETALTTGEKFVERAAAIKGNKDLSEQGRAKNLQAQTLAALRDIRDAGAPIDAMKTKLAALVATIKPVSFDKSDLAGALLRQELRGALRAMPFGEKAAALLGEKADPAFVDSALEAPAILSGVDPQMFEKVREQRLETLFSRENSQAEALGDQISEANAALEIARGDVSRSSGLLAHEFTKLVAEVQAKKGGPWLKRVADLNGGEKIIVVRPGESSYPAATPDEIRDGVFYRDYAEYQARAV